MARLSDVMGRIDVLESRTRVSNSSPVNQSSGSKQRPVKSMFLRDEEGGVYEVKVKAGSLTLTRVG